MIPQPARVGILILLVFFSHYMVWEASRWLRGNQGGLTRGQIVRRLFCGLLLWIDLFFWLVGDGLMQGQPPRRQLIYWLAVMLPIPICMMLAVRESGAVIRQYIRSRRELYGSTLSGAGPKSNGADPG